VKNKINEAAFHYLSKIKDTHSKVKDIFYEKLEIQPFIHSGLEWPIGGGIR